MSRYRFQIYTPDLERQVCLLQKRLYRSFTWRHAGYLDWKYLRNPYCDEPLVYVALVDGRVAGIRGMFGSCWEAGAENMVLPCASDTGVDPEHRNSGLFEELTEFAMEDVQARGFTHVLNLSPTAENYVVSIMTMGWRPLGSSKELIRDECPAAAGGPAVSRPNSGGGVTEKVRQFAGKLVVGAQKTFGIDAFVQLDRNARECTDPFSMSRIPKPEVMEEIAGRTGGGGRIRHVRDRNYFLWRFNNPRFCYRFLFRGEREPEGYLVLQNRIGDPRVNIADWEGINAQVRAELLETTVRLGGFRTIGAWGTALDDSSLETLSRNGFHRPAKPAGSNQGYSGHFMIKSMKPEAETTILGCDPLKEDSWDLRMIYSDGA